MTNTAPITLEVLGERLASLQGTMTTASSRLDAQSQKIDKLTEALVNMQQYSLRISNLEERVNYFQAHCERRHSETDARFDKVEAAHETRKTETQPIIERGKFWMNVAGGSVVAILAGCVTFAAWFLDEQSALRSDQTQIKHDLNEKHIEILKKLSEIKGEVR